MSSQCAKAGDGGGAVGVGFAQHVDGLVGEHDAPAERVVGVVALDYEHLVAAVKPFEGNREIEAGGTAAHANRSHRESGSFRLRFI